MIYFKQNYFLSAVVIAFIALFPLECVQADAPFITDDPGIMDFKTWDIYLYETADKYKALTVLQAPAIEFDYGFAPDFEMDAYLPVVNNMAVEPELRSGIPNSTGLGDLDVEIKYGLFKETKNLPMISFVPNVFIPTGNSAKNLGNGHPWITIPVAIEKTIGHYVAYAEFGYGVNNAPDTKHYFFGGCVVSHNFTDNLGLGAEIYSQGGMTSFIKAYTVLNLGAAYQLSKNFSTLFSFGHNIIGQENWTTYLGISYSK